MSSETLLIHERSTRWRINIALALWVGGFFLPMIAGPTYARNTSADMIMQILRDKLKADKKVVVAANMQLTDTEAKALWRHVICRIFRDHRRRKRGAARACRARRPRRPGEEQRETYAPSREAADRRLGGGRARVARCAPQAGESLTTCRQCAKKRRTLRAARSGESNSRRRPAIFAACGLVGSLKMNPNKRTEWSRNDE
jgi:hypothetical protein